MTPPVPQGRRPGRRHSEWWKAVGLVLACSVAMVGLVILAFFVLVVIAMANMGSNK